MSNMSFRSSKLAEYRQHFSFKSSEQSRRNSCEAKTGQRNGIGTISFLARGVGVHCLDKPPLPASVAGECRKIKVEVTRSSSRGRLILFAKSGFRRPVF